MGCLGTILAKLWEGQILTSLAKRGRFSHTCVRVACSPVRVWRYRSRLLIRNRVPKLGKIGRELNLGAQYDSLPMPKPVSTHVEGLELANGAKQSSDPMS